VPVAVENDVKAAALGAWRLRVPSGTGTGTGTGTGIGTAADTDTGAGARSAAWPGPVGVGPDGWIAGKGLVAEPALAYLNLGTGLASAVVRDGVVVRGIDGAAGEIGHLPIGGDAPCTCGQVGCLETVASGSALARLWPAASRRTTDPFAAAAAGDPLASAAVDVLCTGVGLAVQLLALASGAERIVVGGGLAGLGAPLLDGIRADLDRRAGTSRIIDALSLPDRVELLTADVPVAALGAAWLTVRDAQLLSDVGTTVGSTDTLSGARLPGEKVG